MKQPIKFLLFMEVLSSSLLILIFVVGNFFPGVISNGKGSPGLEGLGPVLLFGIFFVVSVFCFFLFSSLGLIVGGVGIIRSKAERAYKTLFGVSALLLLCGVGWMILS